MTPTLNPVLISDFKPLEHGKRPLKQMGFTLLAYNGLIGTDKEERCQLKVRVEIDSELTDKEIVIRAPEYDAEIQELYQSIQKSFGWQHPLIFYKGTSEYYLNLDEVLFFETDGRQVHAHTNDDEYVIHHRLYELEELLPGRFARVSKSAMINIRQVYALTHSLSSTVVRFQGSQKQVYVSRRYYKVLKEKLKRGR